MCMFLLFVCGMVAHVLHAATVRTLGNARELVEMQTELCKKKMALPEDANVLIHTVP